MLRIALVLLLAIPMVPRSSGAQGPPAPPNIKVALQVTEPPDGASFQSLFASALRSIGDVELIDEPSDADIVIRLVAICSGADCAHAPEYAVAIALSEPIGAIGTAVAARAAGVQSPPDSLIRQMRQVLSPLEVNHRLFVALWGRSRYEQASREMVARIDAQCFERSRIVWRTLRNLRPGEDAADAVKQRMAGHDWIC